MSRLFSIRRPIGYALAALTLPVCASAQVSTWNATGGNWSQASNWLPPNVPDTVAETAVVSGAAATPTIDDNFTIGSAYLTAGQFLGDGSHSLTTVSLFSWHSGTIGAGATVNVLGTASLAWGGAIANLGTLNINSSAVFTSLSNAINNSGTIIMDGGTLTLRQGTSSGLLLAQSGGTILFGGVGSYTLSPGASLAGSGTFVVASGLNLQTSVTVNNLNLLGTIIGGTLTTSGQLNWISGGMINPGRTTISSTSTLNMSNVIATELSTRELINNGTINWSGSGTVNLRFGARLENNGLLNATGNATMLLPLGMGTALLVNNGTLSKSAGGGTTTLWLPFENYGTVSVSGGTLSIHNGGIGAATSKWIISPGSALRFDPGGGSTMEILSGATITNSGTLINAGYLKVPASVLAGNNLILDAVLGELYVVGDLPVSQFTWERGILSGPGTSATTGMTISDDWGVAAGRVLENSGVINWTAGLWAFGFTSGISAFDNSTAGTISNLSGGQFNAMFSTDLGLADRPELLVVDNAGSFNVAANQSLTLYGRLNNNGTVALASGGSMELTYGSANNGVFNLAPGAQLHLVGSQSHSFGGSSAITGDGLVQVDADSVDFGGSISPGVSVLVGSGTSSLPTLNVLNGAAVNAGTFAMPAGTANILNGASVSVGAASLGTAFGSPAVLQIDSGATFAAGSFDQQPTGTLWLNGGTLQSTTTASVAGGMVVGSGTIDGSLASAGGILWPGDYSIPGDTQTIHITGDLTLDAMSYLAIDVNVATMLHTADLLDVGGIVQADGYLYVLITGDPSSIGPTESFVVLSAAGGISGSFIHDFDGRVYAYDELGQIVGSFNVSYSGTQVVLDGFVPEPGSALMMMLATALLLKTRRR